jgi:hypothetical protein
MRSDCVDGHSQVGAAAAAIHTAVRGRRLRLRVRGESSHDGKGDSFILYATLRQFYGVHAMCSVVGLAYCGE